MSTERKFAKQLRDKYDCVCVGVNTVIDDNPSLNGLKRKPLEVIIDPNLRIPLNSNLLKEKPAKTIIFTSSKVCFLSKLGYLSKILNFLKVGFK